MNKHMPHHTPSGPTCSGTASRTVRLELIDGTPHGLIVAEVMNWTGLVLIAPRTRLPALLRFPETSRSGIYILTGPDPDHPGGVTAYIGETDNAAKRLRNHLRNEDKDFFERVAIIVAKDDNLTKAHARFLESQLLKVAKEAGAVTLGNGTQPDFRILPRADRSDMDYFVDQLRIVLPVLGFDLFRHPVDQAPAADASGKAVVFTFSTAGASANARETAEGFVVLAGSTARAGGSKTFPEGYRARRDQLVQEGRLVEGPTPELYQFTKDVAFPSPSAAASIVAARNDSGPLVWKVKGSEQSYREWRAARLDEG